MRAAIGVINRLDMIIIKVECGLLFSGYYYFYTFFSIMFGDIAIGGVGYFILLFILVVKYLFSLVLVPFQLLWNVFGIRWWDNNNNRYIYIICRYQ